MQNLVMLSTLFIVGSLVGWGIEVVFRRFVSRKKWMNPGFLTGPYLPIYGLGVVVLYAISNIHISIFGAGSVAIRIIIIAFSMTFIEFVVGLIFTKGMGLKLWDYSDRKGNIMGIICPEFSAIWLIVGSIYYFFLNPIFVSGIKWISDNLIYTYFIGIVVGMIIVDLAYSIHLASRVKKINELRAMRFEDVKREFKSRVKKIYNLYKTPNSQN